MLNNDVYDYNTRLTWNFRLTRVTRPTLCGARNIKFKASPYGIYYLMRETSVQKFSTF